jgi:hypothetical protein
MWSAAAGGNVSRSFSSLPLAGFGIRSEVNVFIDAKGTVHVTGGKPQDWVLSILEMW